MKSIGMRLFILAASLTLIFALGFGVVSASSEPLSIGVLAPSSELVKGGIRGQSITFSPTDFDTALGVSGIKAIEITALPNPEEGRLTLGEAEVSLGQRIARRDISRLTFTPAVPTLSESGFRFKAEGIGMGDSPCIIRFAEEMNYAPSVSHLTSALLSGYTQSDLAISGRLSAYDPEGDELCYLITAYPSHGSLLLTDAVSGTYRYLPDPGYCGEDSFSFAARDCYGNYSREASVKLTVSPREASYTYADLEMDDDYAAALSLEASEIMQSELVGDLHFFHPSREVKLLDFVTMAMKAAGIKPLSRETFFENNDEIPYAQRGYIARAQQMGYVIGELGEKGLVIDVDATLTRAEAAVIVEKILGAEAAPSTLTVFADADAIPTRAEAAVYTAYALGMLELSDGGSILAKETMTRLDAAKMLACLLRYYS